MNVFFFVLGFKNLLYITRINDRLKMKGWKFYIILNSLKGPRISQKIPIHNSCKQKCVPNPFQEINSQLSFLIFFLSSNFHMKCHDVKMFNLQRKKKYFSQHDSTFEVRRCSFMMCRNWASLKRLCHYKSNSHSLWISAFISKKTLFNGRHCYTTPKKKKKLFYPT